MGTYFERFCEDHGVPTTSTFVVEVGDGVFDAGTEIEISFDDNSPCPQFRSILTGQPRYVELSSITPKSNSLTLDLTKEEALCAWLLVGNVNDTGHLYTKLKEALYLEGKLLKDVFVSSYKNLGNLINVDVWNQNKYIIKQDIDNFLNPQNDTAQSEYREALALLEEVKEKVEQLRIRGEGK